MASRAAILKLYKDMLRYSETLRLTDKEFYLRRIRFEFKKNKNLTTKEESTFSFQKGVNFLHNKRLI